MSALTITVVDVHDPAEKKTTEYEVELVAKSETEVRFKSSRFPPPALGMTFYLDGREINVREGVMRVEGENAVNYFSATFV